MQLLIGRVCNQVVPFFAIPPPHKHPPIKRQQWIWSKTTYHPSQLHTQALQVWTVGPTASVYCIPCLLRDAAWIMLVSGYSGECTCTYWDIMYTHPALLIEIDTNEMSCGSAVFLQPAQTLPEYTKAWIHRNIQSVHCKMFVCTWTCILYMSTPVHLLSVICTISLCLHTMLLIK